MNIQCPLCQTVIFSEFLFELKLITDGPDLLRLEYQNYVQTMETSFQDPINTELYWDISKNVMIYID